MTLAGREQVEDLLDRASELDRRSAQPLLEEAVRLADALQDVRLGLRARDMLVDAATFSGRSDIGLVAFAWILAHVDRDPELECELGDLMWMYKWIAANAAQYPHIERVRLDALIADMERRYRERGLSLRAVYSIRCRIALLLGEPPQAMQHLERLKSEPKDGSNDCTACETNREVEVLALNGRLDAALAAGEPLFDGRQACAEVPANTCSMLLLPLLERGERERAESFQRRAERDLERVDDPLLSIGHHLAYLGQVGRHDHGVGLLQRHALAALDHKESVTRFYFFRGAAHLVAGAAGRCARVPLAAGRRLPFSPDAAGYDTARLATHFREIATDEARRLDRRNGNAFYGERVALGAASS